MMTDFRFGETFSGGTMRACGLLTVIANVFWRDADGKEHTDAALAIMRRSFGVGKMNLLLRCDAWRVREPAMLMTLAEQAGAQLFNGSANTHEICTIADLMINNLDDLVRHPAESEAVELKRREKEMSRDGLLLRVGDHVLVDAR